MEDRRFVDCFETSLERTEPLSESDVEENWKTRRNFQVHHPRENDIGEDSFEFDSIYRNSQELSRALPHVA